MIAEIKKLLEIIFKMSKMYASITSDCTKTEGTKRAHKFANAHVRGWDIGVEIIAYTIDSYDDNDGKLCFEVFLLFHSHYPYVIHY